MMALVTGFTEMTGCRVPIQQAPMGSVSTPALAVAVADAGGAAASISVVEPVAQVIQSWYAAAQGPR